MLETRRGLWGRLNSVGGNIDYRRLSETSIIGSINGLHLVLCTSNRLGTREGQPQRLRFARKVTHLLSYYTKACVSTSSRIKTCPSEKVQCWSISATFMLNYV